MGASENKHNIYLTGLRAGGGGAWGGLKVEGLDKALLAQVHCRLMSGHEDE